MLIDDRISDLICYVMPGTLDKNNYEFINYHNIAYDFWRVFMGYEMRSENLNDIDKKLSSDSFGLHQDIYTLFYGKSIVGLFCFDTKNILLTATRDQSYFKSYPQEILNNYIWRANKIMTVGHLLVHPNWRRSKIGLGLSDILVWFMHKRFLESKCDLMVYWTRNNRKTNNLGKKFGGRVISQKLEYGGLEADIILTKPSEVIMDSGNTEVNDISIRLWSNKVFLS